MALAGPDPSPELREVFDLCDRASLTAFSWAIFEAWRDAREPNGNGWVVSQLGWLGDDETVRRLTPIIRVWPGRSGHHKAILGVKALTAIGTDVALMHLNGIAQKVKFTGLKEAAQGAIDEVARARGLTSEQLADRLVPDFGLDADTGLTLDYGRRAFRVAFDEQLRPYVTDEDGKARKTLPKPGVKDDAALAPAAYRRFATLKKDVRTVASDQIVRLERAMIGGRRWRPEQFRACFADHPLIRHIARRLVWLADDRPFRIAEDRTLADADDRTFVLPGDAEIGIAHPVELGDGLPDWTELFADYEILQPFPQLERPVHRLTDEEAASPRLSRFEGLTVPTFKLLGLTRHGWSRGTPQDGGIEHDLTFPAGNGLRIRIVPDPGITVGAIDIAPEQTLSRVMIGDRSHRRTSPNGHPTFGALPPVLASEILLRLTELTSDAPGRPPTD
jgi:hypothetical protein